VVAQTDQVLPGPVTITLPSAPAVTPQPPIKWPSSPDQIRALGTTKHFNLYAEVSCEKMSDQNATSTALLCFSTTGFIISWD
jgi:hypothetical protein